MINLKKIETETDIKFLYELLKERPADINISHKELPSYEQHKTFVESNPYYLWFIIWLEDHRVGSIYKTNLGEIGIFIKKEYRHKGIAKQVIPVMYIFGSKRNVANISPFNKKSIDCFIGLGFELIQYTYEFKEG